MIISLIESRGYARVGLIVKFVCFVVYVVCGVDPIRNRGGG